MANSSTMKRQYEAWPYPHVPTLAAVRQLDPWQLHLPWLQEYCGLPATSGRGRIWIAGCGTFQPHVLATANPAADVLASDLSGTSLARARRRCRLHGQRNVAFSEVDLSRAGDSTAGWPDGPFDWIECYGVLMNLPDPAASLRALAGRLAPGGVLRLMVYPRWSRHRIFQVQRVAKIMGFSAGDRDHPARFRQMMLSLPEDHPLHRAVATYHDAANDAGIVDAFLHAGDRGFGAQELVRIAADAGLRAGAWFHRPWAQPRTMGPALGMAGFSDATVLDHLDLWQELRGNLVPCFVKSREGGPAAPRESQPSLRAHPLFQGGGVRRRLERLKGMVRGVRLPDRMGYEPVRLSPGDVRLLANWRPGDAAETDRARSLQQRGLLLPHVAGQGSQTRRRTEPCIDDEAANWIPAPPYGGGLPEEIAVGPSAPNPFHLPLFAAWWSCEAAVRQGRPDLSGHLAAWREHGDPLEGPQVPVGLTPHGSWESWGSKLGGVATTAPGAETHVPRGALRLPDDDRALRWGRDWLHHWLPERREPIREVALRELWLLLQSWRQPTLDLRAD